MLTMFYSDVNPSPGSLFEIPASDTVNRPSWRDIISEGPPPVALLGIPFDNVTLNEAINRIQLMIAAREPHYVITANVDFLVQAAKDAELRRIFLDAHLVVCDGTPLVWASRWLGNPLPERVAGADIVPELIRVAATRGQRIFFLGATPEANAEAAARVRSDFPGAIIAGHYSPPFGPLEAMDNEEIIQRIRQARPDLLFVAFGCPKAEKWIAKHYRAAEVPVVMGVGATIDFLAGRVKRAPQWMGRCGAEWLFRLCQEPRRLFRRYSTDLQHFSWALTRQLLLMSANQKKSKPTPEELDLPANRPKLIHHGQADGCHWLRLPPHLDLEAVRRGEDTWRCAPDKHCILDLTDLQSIDSTGVALLLRLQRNIRASGKQAGIRLPQGAASRVLREMRVAEVFEQNDSMDAPIGESDLIVADSPLAAASKEGIS